MISEHKELDEIDRKIIKIIEKNPNITHTEIAERVDRSQPTVGLRIKHLEEKGILNFQAGVNFKGSENFFFGQLDLQTKHPDEILDTVKRCHFILNGFRLSGNSNVSIFLTSFHLDHLEKLVNFFFRSNPNVDNLDFRIITDVVDDFILPLDLDFDDCKCERVEECKKIFDETIG
ncbi:MAG: winged helix-turn-helix transcriptional regulator [Candidatus Lokiarchaeota archaeon]